MSAGPQGLPLSPQVWGPAVSTLTDQGRPATPSLQATLHSQDVTAPRPGPPGSRSFLCAQPRSLRGDTLPALSPPPDSCLGVPSLHPQLLPSLSYFAFPGPLPAAPDVGSLLKVTLCVAAELGLFGEETEHCSDACRAALVPLALLCGCPV